jgi:hypothetical protein
VAEEGGQKATRSWFAVRCVFRHATNKPWGPHDLGPGENAYEERITLWKAETADEAIDRAESEAREYAEILECEYTGLVQSYLVDGNPRTGAEVFSLIRRSELAPERYLDTFFDTGTEYQSKYVPRDS